MVALPTISVPHVDLKGTWLANGEWGAVVCSQIDEVCYECKLIIGELLHNVQGTDAVRKQ